MKLTFVAIVPNYWGKGDSPDAAKKRVEEEMGRKLKKDEPMVLYITNDSECHVDGIDGGLCYHTTEGLWVTKFYKGQQIEVYG